MRIAPTAANESSHTTGDLLMRMFVAGIHRGTDCTLVEASSEAEATVEVNSCARRAVVVSVLAEASNCVEADDTVSMISPIAASN